jgi:hypothetical protein
MPGNTVSADFTENLDAVKLNWVSRHSFNKVYIVSIHRSRKTLDCGYSTNGAGRVECRAMFFIAGIRIETTPTL